MDNKDIQENTAGGAGGIASMAPENMISIVQNQVKGEDGVFGEIDQALNALHESLDQLLAAL